MMKDTQLAFIGGGNMATSLIGGLVADNLNPNQITVSDSDDQQRERLAAHPTAILSPVEGHLARLEPRQRRCDPGIHAVADDKRGVRQVRPTTTRVEHMFDPGAPDD